MLATIQRHKNNQQPIVQAGFYSSTTRQFVSQNTVGFKFSESLRIYRTMLGLINQGYIYPTNIWVVWTASRVAAYDSADPFLDPSHKVAIEQLTGAKFS